MPVLVKFAFSSTAGGLICTQRWAAVNNFFHSPMHCLRFFYELQTPLPYHFIIFFHPPPPPNPHTLDYFCGRCLFLMWAPPPKADFPGRVLNDPPNDKKSLLNEPPCVRVPSSYSSSIAVLVKQWYIPRDRAVLLEEAPTFIMLLQINGNWKNGNGNKKC